MDHGESRPLRSASTMPPKSKKKKKAAAADNSSGLGAVEGEPGEGEPVGEPIELKLLVPILEERLARIQGKLAVEQAGHREARRDLEKQQGDQKGIFEHLERELAKKTAEVATLEARVLVLQEENGMQSMLAGGRLASQQEAYEAEIARLKRDHDIVEADIAPSFSAPAAAGEQATPRLFHCGATVSYRQPPVGTHSADSYDAKQLLRMIVASRPSVYFQVRAWLLDESGTKGAAGSG